MTSPQAHDHPHDTMKDTADDGGPHLPNIPLLEDELEHGEAAEKKPTWRGWIHAGTFPLAIAAGIVLIVLAEGAPAKWSAAVFMATSLLLFGISAVYHRFNWSPKVKAIFRRIDHSNIFLLIAGTYTPLAICALPPEKSVILLSLVWGGALLGIGFRIFWLKAPRWLYVAALHRARLGRDDVHRRPRQRERRDDGARPGRRRLVHRGRDLLRAQAAEPDPRGVRLPRAVPHGTVHRVPVPLDRDPADRHGPGRGSLALALLGSSSASPRRASAARRSWISAR